MDSDSAWLTRFFAQLAYVAMALVAVFTRASLIDLAIIFGGLMLVGMLV